VERKLPTGTVSFLFTDIEGSTRLLQRLGDGYAEVLADHHRVLREVWERHSGVEVDTQGDAFFVAFARASDAVAAAADAQRALADGPARVRMGIHTGEPVLSEEGYVGYDLHRAARIAAAGHGGQVLLSQATADLSGADARDLGLHRLKDLSAPERLFQFGTNTFPPLKTLHQTNLPVPATPFLGREQEVDQIVELLRRPEVRLVTLSGPGGGGKTRLALQACAAAADAYARGVWWVPLAAVADSALVEASAAHALGSKDSLAATVGDHRMLLLLDNFEHLIDAASVVAETIGSCPRLTVLVTSREPLHVDGEWEVAVDPMREREAVALFVQRALAVTAECTADTEIVEICRRLDCLPLAIELAAARVKALSPAVLLERLEQRLPLLAGGSRSAPERQRTLRATISWSYDLLSSVEQHLFARLAVFVDGGSLDAAEAICRADIDSVASLVDKSLLRRTGDRYWMLGTIREFAAERLDELADLPEIRAAHAAWHVELAERAQPELRGREARTWLERLDSEHGNLRAALDHLLEIGDAEAASRLSGALWPYWQTRGDWTEGRRYLRAAVALGADLDPERLVDLLWGGATLALWQGDIGEAERLASRILEISETAEDHERAYSQAIHVLAIIAARRGDFGHARALNEELLEICRRGGDPWLLSIALNNLGNVFMSQRDHAHAIELFEESLAVGEARGDLDRRARANHNLGEATHATGDLDRAREFFRRSLDAATEIGLIESQLWALSSLAAVEAEAGNPRLSARLFGHAMELASRLGASHDESEVIERQTFARLEAALGPELITSELAAGAALSLEDAIELAFAQGTPGLENPCERHAF